MCKEWEPADLPFEVHQRSYPTGESRLDAYWRTLLFDSGYANFHEVHARLTPNQVQDYRQLFLEWTRQTTSTASKQTTRTATTTRPDARRSFTECISWSPSFSTLDGWTFGTTSKGYFMRTQPEVKRGDVVALLYGSTVPIILRAAEDAELALGPSELHGKRFWKFIGSAYVHGVMDGEWFVDVAESHSESCDQMEFLLI